jgi:hypothetical protein
LLLFCRLRVSQWVNDSFNGHGHKGHGADPEEQEAGAHVVVALHKPGSHAAGKGKHAKEGSDEEEAEAPGRKQSDGGSVAEGSQSGDDAMSAITSSAGGDEGEELSADFRWVPLGQMVFCAGSVWNTSWPGSDQLRRQCKLLLARHSAWSGCLIIHCAMTGS